MTETYNASGDIDKPTFFNHLLLESDVRKITSREGFDPANLTVKLLINEEVATIKDFNEVLDDWSNRIKRQVKDELDYFSKESSVKEMAKKLLKDKLGAAYDVVSEIENSAWKLDL